MGCTRTRDARPRSRERRATPAAYGLPRNSAGSAPGRPVKYAVSAYGDRGDPRRICHVSARVMDAWPAPTCLSRKGFSSPTAPRGSRAWGCRHEHLDLLHPSGHHRAAGRRQRERAVTGPRTRRSAWRRGLTRSTLRSAAARDRGADPSSRAASDLRAVPRCVQPAKGLCPLISPQSPSAGCQYRFAALRAARKARFRALESTRFPGAGTPARLGCLSNRRRIAPCPPRPIYQQRTRGTCYSELLHALLAEPAGVSQPSRFPRP